MASLTVVMTLDRAPIGSKLTLVAAHAEPGLCRRLATLGMRCGAPVRVVSRTSGGGRVVAVAGSRVALDRSLMQQLEVRAA